MHKKQWELPSKIGNTSRTQMKHSWEHTWELLGTIGNKIEHFNDVMSYYTTMCEVIITMKVVPYEHPVDREE